MRQILPTLRPPQQVCRQIMPTQGVRNDIPSPFNDGSPSPFTPMKQHFSGHSPFYDSSPSQISPFSSPITPPKYTHFQQFSQNENRLAHSQSLDNISYRGYAPPLPWGQEQPAATGFGPKYVSPPSPYGKGQSPVQYVPPSPAFVEKGGFKGQFQNLHLDKGNSSKGNFSKGGKKGGKKRQTVH